MRLALYVATSRGLAALNAAVATGVDIAYVISARDPSMADDGFDRIRTCCQRAAVPFLADPGSGAVAAPATHTLAVGWRRLLDRPNLIVLHDSLLPRYRGFAPLVTALINGEPEVGVTALIAGSEPDTGPIVGQLAVPVTYPATIAATIGSVEPLYARLVTDLIRDWPTEGVEQDHAAATWSLWRDEHDFRIDWAQDAETVKRHVDAVGYPYQGAVPTPGLRTSDVTVVDDVDIEIRQPGKVFRIDDRRPVIVCGRGMVRLNDVDWTKLRTRFG